MSKVRNLPEITSPDDNDLLYMVDASEGPNGGKKITFVNLKAGLAPTAGEVEYNPATSSLNATDVQDALDEIDQKVQEHSGRHAPDNADGLAVGDPVTVGTANAAGNANSYSRSDHVHDHGAQTNGSLHAAASASVSGFMSSTDKSKLDKFAQGFLQYRNSALYTNSTTTFSALSLNTDVDSFANSLFTKVNTTDFRVDFTGYVEIHYHATPFTDTNDRGVELTVTQNGTALERSKGRIVGKNQIERTVTLTMTFIVPCTNGDVFALAARATEAGPVVSINASLATMLVKAYRIS